MKKYILIIAAIILLSLSYIFIFQNPFLKLSVSIDKKTILLNEKYQAKIKASMLFVNLEKKVTKNTKFNNKKIGVYKITYQVKFLGTKKKVIKKINVVDSIAPNLDLTKDDITINLGDEYKEPGYVATDNYDGDITNNVKIDSNLDNNKEGEYLITYSVEDSSKNKTTKTRKVTVKKKVENVISTNSSNTINETNGLTYIKGILIVNKKYSVPSTYAPGIDATALSNLHRLQADAKAAGFNIPTLSAYRSYQTQQTLFNNYYAKDSANAEMYSARPGHSEHQTGLAFDVGEMEYTYGDTPGGQWLYNNCANYGFIIRYLRGKENITGYVYEPWHIRYVGDVAKEIMSRNITLEEYLKIA